MAQYIPRPIETSGIALPGEIKHLTELLAENAHDVWARERLAAGWTWGSSRDDAHKRHPCLVPYKELPESEKVYDREIAQGTLKAIIALGYRIEKA